jgi:REP element-mobilizing transposase RayT
VDSYNTNLSSEPGTSPLGIRNFRFHYTCLLIPRNPQQFLTRDLSERLSFLIPQLHLEYGWRLTGITIRPQYMLWSVSLPIDACPIHLLRDIRRRTTAHITSNFTELTPIGNGDDFWASGFFILSRNTSPTIGMIADFIRQTRTNQSLHD